MCKLSWTSDSTWSIPSKGSFKCYVTLEGVGGYMPKRYEALRGGGGLHQRYVTSFFLANTAWFPRVRRGF